MSFILDALRKAERERTLGQTPDLSNNPPPAPLPAARSRSPRRLAALIALVLVLAVLTVVFWPRSGTAPTEPAVALTAPAAAELEPAPETAPPEAAPEVETPVDQAQVAALDEGSAPESLDELVEDPVVTDPAPAAETETVLSLEDQQAEAQAQAAAEKQAAAEDAEAAEPAEPEPQAAAAATDLENVKRLRDMPAAFRSNFPAVKLEVHVYDVEPAKRWVLINGKKYGEGVAIAEGPEIAAITPDGIVFSHRGERVLVPLNR